MTYLASLEDHIPKRNEKSVMKDQVLQNFLMDT